MADKKIKISCESKDFLAMDRLKPIQGKLKKLTKRNYRKFRNQIVNHGIAAPIFVWRDDGTNWIVDGHQRLKTVKRMIENDGYELKDNMFPVMYVHAANYVAAKKLVLSFISQYGVITNDGLTEFLTDIDFDLDFIADSFELPNFDIEGFATNTKGKKLVEEVNRGDEDSEWAGMPEFKPGEKDIRLTVYFDDEDQREKYVQEKEITITKVQNNQWISRISNIQSTLSQKEDGKNPSQPKSS